MAYHFISGLPRSGSTLLAALLRQNPRFYADVTSPLARLYAVMLLGMSDEHAGNLSITNAKRERLLRGLFDAYYADSRAEAGVIFDTNRSWCTRIAGLKALFPEARVLCCVRDVAWVVDSLERLVHRNPFHLSSLFGYEAEGSVTARAELVMAHQGVVGAALDGLKQAYYGDDADRLLLIRYETLVGSPRETLDQVYAFLSEARFEHDFDNVEFEADALDERLRTPGLHRVRRQVSFEPRTTLLPPELFEHLQGQTFWSSPAANLRGVKVI